MEDNEYVELGILAVEYIEVLKYLNASIKRLSQLDDEIDKEKELINHYKLKLKE